MYGADKYKIQIQTQNEIQMKYRMQGECDKRNGKDVRRGQMGKVSIICRLLPWHAPRQTHSAKIQNIKYKMQIQIQIHNEIQMKYRNI